MSTNVTVIVVPDAEQREAAFRDGAYWGREAKLLGVGRESALEAFAEEIMDREPVCAADLAAGFIHGFDS